MPEIRIVFATERDIPLVLTFIRKLAEYERLSHRVAATEQSLTEALFGSRPAAEVVLAYLSDDAVGFAVFFSNFSTFLGQSGIYLEDLFVDPTHRGRGIGKAMLVFLANLARERGCGRLEWAVLDWNKPAIEFYKKLGAEPLDQWTVFRLNREGIDALGSRQDRLPQEQPG